MKIKLTTSLMVLSIIFCGFYQKAFAAEINSETSIQNAVLYYINQYRSSHGLGKLSMDNRIVREARQHSLDMATHRMAFGHTEFFTRVRHMRSQIKNGGAAAENVAYNYKTAEDVVKNWLRSPGHKQNIDGHYNLTGIGVVRDKQGKLYYTQIFLNAKG